MARTIIVALGTDVLAEVTPFEDPAKARAFFIEKALQQAEVDGGIWEPYSESWIKGEVLREKLEKVLPQELRTDPEFTGGWGDEALDFITRITSVNFEEEGPQGIQFGVSRDGIDAAPFSGMEEPWGIHVDTTDLANEETRKVSVKDTEG